MSERTDDLPQTHWFASLRNRSVRGSIKPPRAPRVRNGFAQTFIHHRHNRNHDVLKMYVARGRSRMAVKTGDVATMVVGTLGSDNRDLLATSTKGSTMVLRIAGRGAQLLAI